jgi:hypothetical protein
VAFRLTQNAVAAAALEGQAVGHGHGLHEETYTSSDTDDDANKRGEHGVSVFGMYESFFGSFCRWGGRLVGFEVVGVRGHVLLVVLYHDEYEVLRGHQVSVQLPPRLLPIS